MKNKVKKAKENKLKASLDQIPQDKLMLAITIGLGAAFVGNIVSYIFYIINGMANLGTHISSIGWTIVLGGFFILQLKSYISIRDPPDVAPDADIKDIMDKFKNELNDEDGGNDVHKE